MQCSENHMGVSYKFTFDKEFGVFFFPMNWWFIMEPCGSPRPRWSFPQKGWEKGWPCKGHSTSFAHAPLRLHAAAGKSNSPAPALHPGGPGTGAGESMRARMDRHQNRPSSKHVRSRGSATACEVSSGNLFYCISQLAACAKGRFKRVCVLYGALSLQRNTFPFHASHNRAEDHKDKEKATEVLPWMSVSGSPLSPPAGHAEGWSVPTPAHRSELSPPAGIFRTERVQPPPSKCSPLFPRLLL